MKAKELIELLERFDLDKNVEIAIKQTNKIYPIAYVNPWEVSNYRPDKIRIYCTLPDNMYTSKRKK